MDLSPPEGQPLSPDLLIKLNQKISPFTAKNCKPESLEENERYKQMNQERPRMPRLYPYYRPTRKHLIELPLGIKFPIEFTAGQSHSQRLHALTPFSDNGYKITEEDYDVKKRLVKANLPENKKNINHDTDPLSFIAKTSMFEAQAHGLTISDQVGRISFKEIVGKLLPFLKLTLFFPKGLIVKSAPYSNSINIGQLSYNDFYPVDLGPLPIDANSSTINNEGFSIFLPADFDILYQIRAEFTMDMKEEEPVEPPQEKKKRWINMGDNEEVEKKA